uniref:Odorant receptor, family D, subfamily 107, member 1 n=1 Tax=Sinocyclocheilus grahami TaxID=75366 RepID=A0A672MIB8_SINGR
MNFSVAVCNGTNSFNEGFYLTAFHTQNKNYLILALAIIYIRGVLLTVVLMNSSLQNPKYLALCNLAIVDISMNTCFSQMFFMHFFGDMESFSLALLAYDRLIAICWPLCYSTINTNLSMLLIIVGIWSLVVLLEIFPVVLAARLSYCGSREVNSCCCEHGPVYRLASKTLTVLLGPLSFIILTYVIVVVVTRIASISQRWKAFHTCLTHLMLVLLFYMPVILAYKLGNLRLVQNSDLFTAILTVSVTLPPMLNPIIYSLKTDELRDKIVKLLGKPKVAQQIIKNEANG